MHIRSILGFAAAVAAAVAVGCGGAGGDEPTGKAEGAGSTSSEIANVDCTALANDLAKLRSEVEACNPLGPSLNTCSIALDDVCCPITANGGPIEKFKEAVSTYVASCKYACTAVVCHVEPTKVCRLNGVCQQ